MFQEETFTPANITHMDKKISAETRNFSKPYSFKNVGVFLITLKEKFYPFKIRQDLWQNFQTTGEAAFPYLKLSITTIEWLSNRR